MPWAFLFAGQPGWGRGLAGPTGLELATAGMTGQATQGHSLLLDSAPITYILEDHPKLTSRFMPFFEDYAQDECDAHVRASFRLSLVKRRGPRDARSRRFE